MEREAEEIPQGKAENQGPSNRRGEERRESANVLTQRRRDSGDRETPPGSPAPRQEDGKGLVVGTEGEPLRGRAPVT